MDFRRKFAEGKAANPLQKSKGTESQKRKKLLHIAVPMLFLVLTACGGSGGDTTYDKTIQAMIPFVEQQMQGAGVVGLSIALIDDQRTVWARGFGYSDLAAQKPASANTQFEIGSNTKTFAGTMAAQLVEQWLLRIDDPLSAYLTDFAVNPPLGFPAGGPVTIRSMLSHHSGIPGDLLNGAFTFGSARPNFNRWMRDYLVTDYLHFPTDLIFSYSNTAVSLLADVIAAASGTDFNTAIEALFQRIGMDRTAFSPGSPRVTDLSKGYFQKQELGPFYCNLGTAGSIISTVNDMAKYLKMVMSGGMGERGRVMSPATLDMMLTAQPAPPLDFNTRVGFCWMLNDPDLDYAGRLCWHNGGTISMHSHMEVLRDHKLAVVVLSNSIEGEAAAAKIAKQALKLALEEKTGIKPPGPYSPEFSPVVPWPQPSLDALAGIYVLCPEAGYVKVASVPGGLQWTDSTGPVSVVPRADGRLSAADSQVVEYEFAVISGRNVIIRHKEGKVGVYAEKYTPVPIPAAWSARVGTWEAVDQDPADFRYYFPGWGNDQKELAVADGMIIFDHYVVKPKNDTLGYVRGLGRNMGTAVQIYTGVGPDAHEELRYLGIRYKKL
jgi:CubicO group peptidase (beta-lactamase class C family)